MAPDVNPVGERDEPVPADGRRLDCAFPVDAERVFQIDDVPTVRECLARCSYCEVTNGEIGKDRTGDKRRLAQRPSSMLTRSERPTAFPSARSGRVGDGVEISVLLTD
jgi:hypothetical protein